MTAEEISNKINHIVDQLDDYLNSDTIDFNRKDPKSKILRAIERLYERKNRLEKK
jgi:hypothetical protein